MKTVEDYRKNILGIRLKGVGLLSQDSNFNALSIDESLNIDLAFFADPNDLELQRPMVDKILSLFSKAPHLVTNPPETQLNAQTLFIFGDHLKLEDNFMVEKRFRFQSFSEIAQNPDLKRKLWEKLKKYT